MLDWRGSGMSVMEMSHRGPEFTDILANTHTLVRDLLRVPDDYAVLFMQGGGLAENAIASITSFGAIFCKRALAVTRTIAACGFLA